MRLEYFQMLDRVVTFDKEAGQLEAEALVPEESPVFEGHFPGFPIMPGVLLLETMAQSCGYLLLSVAGFDNMPFLAGVRRAKFRSFVPPGTRMVVAARMEHHGSGFAVMDASVTVEGKRTCDAELTLKTLPFPAEELRAMMRNHAQKIGLPVLAQA